MLDVAWADNGPGWVGVRMESAAAVLALEPSYGEPAGRCRRRRPAPRGRRVRRRGPCLRAARRRHHRGPGDRLAQRLAGAVAGR
ncbi:hypothetical protein [Nocardioides convexus]|uniref:hypothetical protein n=1 Tax=Nocardioides convexus TaxID=2712224 RepID=UPI002418B6DA|nr:hypothetical protein [Nocardioides convexus]